MPVEGSESSTRTLVVVCPHWSTAAAGADPDEPVAVMAANRVIDVTPAARAVGVAIGHRRREAQARCPSLAVVDHDPARDARRFDPVVMALEDLTPRIEILRPGWCSFPTRGPSRYFGGDRSMADLAARRAAEVVAGMTGDGVGAGPFVPRVGVADGHFAAGLAAEWGPSEVVTVIEAGDSERFLGPFPLSVLCRGGSPLAGRGEGSELVDVWERLGLRTLADVAALHPEDLLARFGIPGMVAHRLSRGIDDRLPDTRPVPPDLTLEAELEPAADRVDTVAFVAKPLADQLIARLAGNGLICLCLAVEVVSDRGETRTRVWRHEHHFTAAAVIDRVRWQLEGWFASRQRPTGGVVLIRLVPEEVAADRGSQLGFWGGRSDEDGRAVRALARVQGLLGADAVTVPERGGGRRLADVERRVSLGSVNLSHERRVTAPDEAGAPWPGRLPPPSPALVHTERIPIELCGRDDEVVVVNGRGELQSEPVCMFWEGRRRTLRAWSGPWPVEERWWDSRHRRQARLQVVSDDDVAYLVVLEGGTWWIEATYR